MNCIIQLRYGPENGIVKIKFYTEGKMVEKYYRTSAESVFGLLCDITNSVVPEKDFFDSYFNGDLRCISKKIESNVPTSSTYKRKNLSH